VHGIGQWHYARYPGYQSVCVAGQSRVLRSPRKQRESATIMEIIIRQGRRNRSTSRTSIDYFYVRFTDNLFDNFYLSMCTTSLKYNFEKSTHYTRILLYVKKEDILPPKVHLCFAKMWRN